MPFVTGAVIFLLKLFFTVMAFFATVAIVAGAGTVMGLW